MSEPTFLVLFREEMARAMRRRLVWVLIAVAMVGAVVIGVVAFATSAGGDGGVPLGVRDPDHPALMRNWWSADGDSPLTVAAVFLLLGAVIGGSSIVGAEWRAGTLPTFLTWEPRRLRVAAARLGAGAVCAALIAVGLQLVLFVALSPAVVAHGSTAGADGTWALAVAAAVARIAIATAMAAVFASAIALATRNTAAAIVVSWAWLSVIENIARAAKPWTARYLFGDSIVRFVSWTDGQEASTRSPAGALAQLATYLAVLVAVAVWTFRNRDAVTS